MNWYDGEEIEVIIIDLTAQTEEEQNDQELEMTVVRINIENAKTTVDSIMKEVETEEDSEEHSEEEENYSKFDDSIMKEAETEKEQNNSC